MATSFLDNLKNAVDNGDFNSEAARKLIEIGNLADTKFIPKTNEELTEKLNTVKEKLVVDNAVTVTEEEAAAINAEYEAYMEDVKKRDAVNVQLATLVEIENMVKLSVVDMLTFIDELEEKFPDELGNEEPAIPNSIPNPMFVELIKKIEEVKTKYSIY